MIYFTHASAGFPTEYQLRVFFLIQSILLSLKLLSEAMATASAAADLATCPICLDLFENPKSLPCLHAVCLKCLRGLCRDMLPGDRATCPTCRKKFLIPRDGVGGLQHHFIVQQLVDEKDKQIQLRDSSCDKHKDEQLKMYCHDCKENVCLICSAVNHRNHDRALITEVADSFRVRIHDDVQQILSAYRSAGEQSQLGVAEFFGNAKDVEKKVIATGDAIKCSLYSEIKVLLMELQAVTSKSAKQAKSVKEAYQLAVVKVGDFCTDSQELLDKGRPSDITRAACELHDRATELLNNIAAVKYCPPHVTFTPADVTQVKRLNLIGKLTIGTDNQPGMFLIFILSAAIVLSVFLCRPTIWFLNSFSVYITV